MTVGLRLVYSRARCLYRRSNSGFRAPGYHVPPQQRAWPGWFWSTWPLSGLLRSRRAGYSAHYVTHAATVAQALQDAGLTLHAGDVVFPDLASAMRQGMTIDVRRAIQVEVVSTGGRHTVRTTSWVPENILAMAGIKVFPGDRILADGLPVHDPGIPLAEPPARLSWSPGTDLTVDTGSGKYHFRTSAATVEGALEEAGFKVYAADSLSPGPSTPIEGPMTVAVHPSRELQIAVDGETVHARASARTVGEALAQAGISLVGLDYARPAVDEPIPSDAKISRCPRLRTGQGRADPGFL